MSKIYLYLISLIVKILCFNLPATKYIRKKITKSSQTYPQEITPPQKLVLTKDYREILKTKPVKPIKHHKPVPQNANCPNCNAPQDFIYFNALVFSNRLKRKVPQLKCKICGRRWLITSPRYKTVSLRCPYCGRCLDLKKRRKEFDVYKCINPKCPHKLKKQIRYTWRDYHINNQIPQPMRYFRTNLPPFTISIIVTLLMCGLSSREIVSFLSALFSINITHTTVLHALNSLASLLVPILPTLPVSCSFPWIIDETYIKCEGRWYYLFSLLDAKGHLIAHHLSATRSVLGAYTVLSKAFSVVKPKEIVIVTDGFSAYPLAFQLFSTENKVRITPIKVIGLRKREGDKEYRRFKNIIENYHSIFKPQLKKMRGFSSYKGAVSYFTLFQVWYNYLKPTSRKRKLLLNGGTLLFGWRYLIEKALNQTKAFHI